jgi:hypothetical protein
MPKLFLHERWRPHRFEVAAKGGMWYATFTKLDRVRGPWYLERENIRQTSLFSQDIMRLGRLLQKLNRKRRVRS